MPKTPTRDMTPKPPEFLAPVADYFKVLSEVSRLQILSCLRAGAMNVSEIGEATGLGQANLSKHLKMLTEAEIEVLLEQLQTLKQDKLSSQRVRTE